MKIWNCSLDWVKKNIECVVNGNDIRLISIGNSDETSDERSILKKRNEGYCGKILYLTFDDSSPSEKSKNDKPCKLFSKADARAILEFAKSAFEDNKTLWGHCGAGISRSAAVSITLNQYFNRILSVNAEDFSYNVEHGFRYKI